mmetsp:Transcript_35363/g.112594  ORF Transcript_35363/g.112594 Transcript_35363/m.112594 type:complete len:403 (-) Transcript_35363:258-1466(-)
MQPAVVVSIGPLAGGRSKGRAQRGRRRIGKALCGGASACFVAGQLVLQHSFSDLSEERHSAPLGATRFAGQAAAGTTIRPGGGDGVGLDELYPPHDGWADGSWSGIGVAAPWLDGIRDAWLRSVGVDAAGALPPVPHYIHQTWKDAFPPRELFSPRWRASLQRSNPGWGYRLWTDAENLQLVRSKYPELAAAYEGYPSPIQRADAARYAIAHQLGGFYFDLDYECFRPLAPLLTGASLVLSYKSGANFSKGASNSVFGSAARHPLWQVVFDVLLNRSRTPLLGHTAVLFSTGPAVLREALRRLLRLPPGQQISAAMLARLREALGIVVLDSSLLHPLTAEQRDLAKLHGELPASAVCTHHFVSSWVAHNSAQHADTERRRREGHRNAAVEGAGLSVRQDNAW